MNQFIRMWYLMENANSEGSSEPAQMHRLAWAFAARMARVWKQMRGQTKMLEVLSHWIAAHTCLETYIPV